MREEDFKIWIYLIFILALIYYILGQQQRQASKIDDLQFLNTQQSKFIGLLQNHQIEICQRLAEVEKKFQLPKEENEDA